MRNRFWKRPLIAAFAAIVLTHAANATPVLLFDPNSGQVLEQSDVFRRWYPASLTKLMTAYVTLTAMRDGELTLKSPIKISKKALRQQPSKMGYPAGTVLTADNALKALLVKSANDIAMALAENVGGSEKAFVERMNAQAAKLGMTDTHFVNPHGLHAEGQYTTARDLAVLVTALRRDFPQDMGYFSIEGIVAGKKTFGNFNLLVGRYRGIDGMKTGYICDSGFNMIGSATRDGRSLVAVVLGEKSAVSRAEAAAALLDKGFAGLQGGPTLSALARPADMPSTPANMREIVCPKPKPGAKPDEKSEAPSPGEVSVWLKPLDHPPALVQIAPGGATGPVPAARLDAEGKAYADVPVPEWRPDVPPPTGFETASQGDSELRQ